MIAASGWKLCTKRNRACRLRHILRWLWSEHGAPKLDHHITRYSGVRPRNVTVTEAERTALLAAAPDHLRLWLLLCSDLAIRSGTAARLNGHNYDQHKRELRFTTKYSERLTMPVTTSIARLIEACDQNSDTGFVRQLWRAQHRHGPKPGAASTSTTRLRQQFANLRKRLGITRRITPHDLRRTTAVAMYEHTGDVRDVQALLGHRTMQSTVWYLDHDLRPVRRDVLELIKQPKPRKETA